MKKILVIFGCILSMQALAQDFEKYLSSFKKFAKQQNLEKEYKKRLDNVIIKIAGIDDIPDNLIGLCNPLKNIVYIDSIKFEKIHELQRQELIDHELGHCVLLRSHYNESILINNGLDEQPTNIMHHKIFKYESIAQMQRYRKSLFDPIFYGTYFEVDRQFSKENEEITVANGNVSIENINKLRRIEHRVSQERLESRNK